MFKVLVVDNVKSILEREKSLLNRDSFMVFTAASGDEALQVHKREKVDIIIIDLHMPGMGGDEVCRAIRADDELKKVSIILTVLTDTPEEIELCNKSGANAHIRKPINRTELAEKMAALLGVPARQSIRILVKVKVEGKLEGKGANDFFIANTVDVSVTGLLFECDSDKIKPGDDIETSFFLPGISGFNRVVTKSKVMRAVGDGTNLKYGVKFLEFREGTQDMVAEFIAKKTGRH